MKKASGFLLANWNLVLRLGLVSIMSLSASAQPAIRGQFSIVGERASRFAFDGEFMHVGTRGGALKIFNIADLMNPALAGSTAISSEGIDLAVNGNFLYYGNPARVVDISNKSRLVIFYPFAFGSIQSLTVEGGRLYVGNYGAIQIYNVQAYPGTPGDGLLGAFDFGAGGWAKKVVARNNLAYATFFKAMAETPQPALRIIDVTDPAFPTLVGQTEQFLDGGDVAVVGNYAYVAAHFQGVSGLAIYDISNPVTPREIYRNATLPGYLPSAIAIRNGVAAVSGVGPQVHLFDVQNPENASRIGDIALPYSGSETDLAFLGDTLAISDGEAGVRFMDISNPAAPALINAVPFGGKFNSIQAAGNYAYVIDAYMGLRVFDVSNPAAPRPASTVRPRKEQRSVFASGSRLFLYSPNNGVEIYSLANPAAPEYLGTYTQGAAITDIAGAGDTLFVADLFGLNVVNISDPAHPTGLTRIRDCCINNLEISGSFLAAQTSAPEVIVYDVANPASPRRIGQIADTFIVDMAIDGSQLYFINGLQVRGAAIAANSVSPSGTYAIGNMGAAEGEAARSVAARNGRVYVLWDSRNNGNNLGMWDARAAGQLIGMGTAATSSNGDLAADDSYAYVVGETVSGFQASPTAWFHAIEGVLPPSPEGPTLSAARVGSEVHIRWPATYTGFTLYTKVGVNGSWQSVTANPPRDGSDFLYVNRFPLAEFQFYRLVK